jgi:hypothetical protein
MPEISSVTVAVFSAFSAFWAAFAAREYGRLISAKTARIKKFCSRLDKCRLTIRLLHIT